MKRSDFAQVASFLLVLLLVKHSEQQDKLVLLSRPSGVFALRLKAANGTYTQLEPARQLLEPLGASDGVRDNRRQYTANGDCTTPFTDAAFENSYEPGLGHVRSPRALDYDASSEQLYFVSDNGRAILRRRLSSRPADVMPSKKKPELLHATANGLVTSLAFDRFSGVVYFITQRSASSWCVEAVTIAGKCGHVVLICSDEKERLGDLGAFCEPHSLTLDSENVANAFLYFVDSGCSHSRPRVLYVTTDGGAPEQARLTQLVLQSGSQVVTYSVSSLTIGAGQLHLLITRETQGGTDEYLVVRCEPRGLHCVTALNQSDLVAIARRDSLGAIAVRALAHSPCSLPWTVLDTTNRLVSCTPFRDHAASIRCKESGFLRESNLDWRSASVAQLVPSEPDKNAHSEPDSNANDEDYTDDSDDSQSAASNATVPDEHEMLVRLRVFALPAIEMRRSDMSIYIGCAALNCSHVCLRSPSSRDRFARCACPPGARLAADARSCTSRTLVEQRPEAVLLVGVRNAEINLLPIYANASSNSHLSPTPSLDAAAADEAPKPQLLLRTNGSERAGRGTIDALELDETNGVLYFIDSVTQYLRYAMLRRDVLDRLLTQRDASAAANSATTSGAGAAKKSGRKAKGVPPVVSEPLLNSGETARAIAFDWQAQQLYMVGKAKTSYSTTENGFIHVFTVRASESSPGVKLTARLALVQSGLQEPKAIAVDSRAGYLFWTDMAILGADGPGRATGCLERSLLDGSHRLQLAGAPSDTREASMSWPSAIALDPDNRLVYVADALRTDSEVLHDSSAVFVFTYGGTYMHRIALRETSGVQALALFGNALYFADSATRHVGLYELSSNNQRTLLRSVFESRSLLAVRLNALPNTSAALSKTANATVCSRLNCSHFCFFRTPEFGGAYCACPVGMRFDIANHTCVQPTFTILLAANGGIVSLAYAAFDWRAQRTEMRSASGSDPLAIAFDVQRRLVFWTDSAARRLVAARLDGVSTPFDVAPTPFDGARLGASLAFESWSDTLFIADPAANRIDAARVVFSAPDGDPLALKMLPTRHDAVFRRTVVWQKVSRPRAIAVDGSLGLLLFANDDGHVIERATLDGLSRRNLLELEDRAVHSLAIDPLRQRVIFSAYAACDPEYETRANVVPVDCHTDIEFVTLNGTDQGALVPNAFASSLFLLDSRLFWSNARENCIESCLLTGFKCTARVTVSRGDMPNIFVVFGASAKPANFSSSNVSVDLETTPRPANGGKRRAKGSRRPPAVERRTAASCSECAHLCFPTGSARPNERFVCECETHFWMSGNRTECSGPRVMLLATQAERVIRLLPTELRNPTLNEYDSKMNNRASFERDPVDMQLSVRLLSAERKENILRTAYDAHSDHVYTLVESRSGRATSFVFRRTNLALRNSAAFSHPFLTLLIADAAISRPFDMAIDEDGVALFYTDQLNNTISATGLDQRKIGVIVAPEEGDRPRLLALAATRALLFWTNEHTRGDVRIEAAHLDGHQRTTLVTGLGNVTALAFDESSGRLFWFDSTSRFIQTLRVDSLKSANTNSTGSPNASSLCLFDASNDPLASIVIASIGRVETMYAALRDSVVRVFIEDANGKPHASCKVDTIWPNPAQSPSAADADGLHPAGADLADAAAARQRNVVALVSVDMAQARTASERTSSTCSDLKCSHLCITNQHGVSECACPLPSRTVLRDNMRCELPDACSSPNKLCSLPNMTVCVKESECFSLLSGAIRSPSGAAFATDSLPASTAEAAEPYATNELVDLPLSTGADRDASNNKVLIGVAVIGSICFVTMCTLACIMLQRYGKSFSRSKRFPVSLNDPAFDAKGAAEDKHRDNERMLNDPTAADDADHANCATVALQPVLPHTIGLAPPSPCCESVSHFDSASTQRQNSLAPALHVPSRPLHDNSTLYRSSAVDHRSARVCRRSCSKCTRRYRAQHADRAYYRQAPSTASLEVIDLYGAAQQRNNAPAPPVDDTAQSSSCYPEPLNPPPTPDPNWPGALADARTLRYVLPDCVADCVNDCRKPSQTSANASIFSAASVHSSELRAADELRRLSSAPSSESNCLVNDARHCRPHHHDRAPHEEVYVEIYVRDCQLEDDDDPQQLSNGLVAPPPSVRGVGESSERRRRRDFRRVRLKAYAPYGQLLPALRHNEQQTFCGCAAVCDCARCAAAAHRHRARLTGNGNGNVNVNVSAPCPSECSSQHVDLPPSVAVHFEMAEQCRTKGPVSPRARTSGNDRLRLRGPTVQPPPSVDTSTDGTSGSSNCFSTNASSRMYMPSNDRTLRSNCPAPVPSLVDDDSNA